MLARTEVGLLQRMSSRVPRALTWRNVSGTELDVEDGSREEHCDSAGRKWM